ncbi:MAG: CBS domain-containing protein, partial [Acidobacteriota bacterium]
DTPNMIYYIYVVENEGSWKLSGVVTLRSLILANPSETLSEVMREQFQSAHTGDSASDAAQTIAEYNLLALPVVDDEGDIAGIVTVDDAMDILMPDDASNTFPKIFG